MLLRALRILHNCCMRTNKALSKLGAVGGRMRSQRLTKVERTASASKASRARWTTPMKLLVEVVTQVRASDIRTGDQLMAFREFWLAKLERNEITQRKFRA